MNFDRVYCIHLPNAERRERIEAEFARVGIKDVQYVHAEKPRAQIDNMRRNPRAELGANLSHIKAVVQAIRDGALQPLFVEDDIEFIRPIPYFPAYGDVLYLGGHPREPVAEQVDNWVRVGKFSIAEAYSIPGDMLFHFYSYWCDRIGQPNAMYDFILGEFAADNYGVCAWPLVTRQRAGYSQIGEKFDDKAELVIRGWANNL